MKNKPLLIFLALVGLAVLVAGAVLLPTYVKAYRAYYSDQKLPRIPHLSFDVFQTENRKQFCSQNPNCFNVWNLGKSASESFVFGMVTLASFGRIDRTDVSLKLGSDEGTTFDILLIKENFESCEEMADILAKSSQWTLTTSVTGKQGDGSYYEQRTFLDSRKRTGLHHCQRYGDATLSVVALIHPQDKKMTEIAVAESLKASTRVARTH